ncbi:MAG: carboxy terminal-processing peptidase [Winogradskyella sp.]
MKFYFSILILFLFNSLHAQSGSFCEDLQAIIPIIADSHYSPKTVNDSLSKGVFKLFLNKIDEHQRFFLQSDIDIFKTDEFMFDDYINNKQCSFVKRYSEVLANRINESKTYLETLKTKQLDYSGTDSLHYHSDASTNYFKNTEAVKKYWSKRVRYRILRKVVESDSVLEAITLNFKDLEKDIKPKVIDNEICLLQELENNLGGISRFVEVSFLDALVKYQDPNSAYLSASDKTQFEKSVSNSQLSFGIETSKNNNGDIVISHISPGSTAFKNGEFEVNDVILSLTSKRETIESYCLSNKTITNFLSDDNIDEVTFRIKKKNGQIKAIKLVKSSLDVEGNSITGFVLSETMNIGYIQIPSFYTDTESLNGLGVANDVAKQIYKLQKENISGLIIDLRFNGGGSMKEAADLSGMFIDRGPVAISKVRSEENYTIRDPNRGSIFNKPIVILVDQFSASASEFFAGAMQDYNRAIIVGSTTHGKATSQLIVPISDKKETNFLKLTMGQFFRVTGKSHQKLGVLPNITLPSIYDNYKTQEKYKDFSLANTSTEVTLKHRPRPKKDYSSIVIKSQNRIENDSTLNSIKAFNHIFINNYVNRTGNYPLSLEFVYNDDKRYNEAWKAYSTAIENNKSIYQVLNTTSTNEILSYNEEDKKLNDALRDKISKDPHIQEAFYIINDLLQL